MDATTVTGGFAHAAHGSAHAFRATLEAMARPGAAQTLRGAQGPAPMSAAASAVLLTVLDHGTPLALLGDFDRGEVRDWLRFHTACSFSTPEQAAFVLTDWAHALPLERFAQGSAAYPDKSATLIVELAQWGEPRVRLSGPGLPHATPAALPFDPALVSNHQGFPLGVDFLFTCGDQVVGLPRSTQVEELSCTSQ